MSDEPIEETPLDPKAMMSINASKFYPDEAWPQGMLEKAADAPPPPPPAAAADAPTQITSQSQPPPDNSTATNDG
jgi:hypothetical protein